MTKIRTAARAAATTQNLSILQSTYAILVVAGLSEDELHRTIHEQWAQMKQTVTDDLR